jgi:tRNA/rRNA methyltransferase/tRNA (cytidine32/uridine32-2'-O)-methyltransferase
VSGSVRIVLVETSHPGNIGAAARALKNMSLDELVLVRPKLFPDAEASARASGATDVLANARVEPDLAAALRDCGLVLATTSRSRDQYFRVLDVRTAARRLVSAAAAAPVAVLFGSERAGLSNQELQCAHALLRIPANPAYASLNLAMAVQIVAYEILCAREELAVGAAALPTVAADGALPRVPASPEQMERFYAHLDEVLGQIGFRDRTHNGAHLMKRIRRLFQRAEPDGNEVNILRGILTAVQQRRRRAGQDT